MTIQEFIDLKEQTMKRTEICKIFGVCHRTMNYWYHGEKLPQKRHYEKLHSLGIETYYFDEYAHLRSIQKRGGRKRKTYLLYKGENFLTEGDSWHIAKFLGWKDPNSIHSLAAKRNKDVNDRTKNRLVMYSADEIYEDE